MPDDASTPTGGTYTFDEAKALVKAVEDAINRKDIDAVAHFGDFPEIRGRNAIRDFMATRWKRQQNYQLRKTLHAVMGNVIAGTWEGDWIDSEVGKRMVGFGTEIWYMEGGKCARWEAAFNIREEGAGPSLAIL
jgi:nuclear transport factor 2 (NTF2) superfamily protein